MSTPPTLRLLLPLPRVLGGFLGQLGVPEPPGNPGKSLTPKSPQGGGSVPAREEQNPAGESRPCRGWSATFHQKSPPSLRPGPGLLHRQNSPSASGPTPKCPRGRGCRGTETSGAAPGGPPGWGCGFWGAFSPPSPPPPAFQPCPMSPKSPREPAGCAGRGHGGVWDPPEPGAVPIPPHSCGAFRVG